MSLLDRYVASHSKVYWTTDKKKEDAIRDRQGIASDFNSGCSLPRILDTHRSEPKYKNVKDEKGWGVMVFDKSNFRPLRCERPCIDNSILWMDKDTQEAIAITYEKEEFEEQMNEYWGLEDDD